MADFSPRDSDVMINQNSSDKEYFYKNYGKRSNIIQKLTTFLVVIVVIIIFILLGKH